MMILRAFGKAAVICGLLGSLGAWSVSCQAGPTTFQVAQGWSLLETDPTQSSFEGLGNLKGVPLGTYNFGTAPDGNMVGTVNTGMTDTIIQRLQTATAPTQMAGASATINIQMVALQLETVNQVNYLGNGMNNYFITLDPSMASTGTMTITWNANGLSGTYSTNLNLDFDIHVGSLTGTVVNTGGTIINLTSSGTLWSNTPPSGATVLPDVNQYLSGTSGDPSQDFWDNTSPFKEMAAGNQIGSDDAGLPLAVPEPSSIAMLSLGCLGVAAVARRRWGAATKA